VGATSVYAAFWIALMVLAIVNGIFRENTYGKHLSDLQAHQLSTLTGIFLMGAAVWLLSLWKWPASAQEALLIGAIWLTLTVLFEFLFGHFIAGHSWQRLLQDYDLLSGRVWLLFLLWILLLPYVVFKFHALAT
jgi:hypothetical protein